MLPVLGVLAVVGTAVAIGIAVIGKINSSGGSSGNTINFEERNVSYHLPIPNWERDDEVKSLLSANLIGLRHTNSGAIAAIEARDYQTRNPQIGELKEGITERMRPLFDDLDLNEEQGAVWAGISAMKYSIRGTARDKLGSGIYLGEAYAIANQGIGYWFVALAPESEASQLAEDLDKLRNRMKFISAREDWKATSSGSVLLVGDAADYRLTDGDGWWKKFPDPRIEDPRADLVYDAEFQSRVKRDIKFKARLTVLVLDPTSDDPMAALREYLRLQFDKLYELKNWQEITGPTLGDAPSSGEQKGIETLRFKVTGSDPNTAKLVILSALTMNAQTPEGMKKMVVGAYAACPFDYQLYWEKRLDSLVGSLRMARSE